MRFFIVDDDELALETLKGFLYDQGYSDFTALTSSTDALERLETESRLNFPEGAYDCFLLDIHMPEINGIELCREIRKRPFGVSAPIIMVTSFTAREHVTKAISAGATDYVTKPYDPIDLASRISAANSLVREQRRVLDQYIRFVTNDEVDPVLGDAFNLPFDATPSSSFVNYRVFENYLIALNSEDAQGIVVLAFRIDDRTLGERMGDEGTFLQLVRRVARKFAKNLSGGRSLFTYVGRGTFVVVCDRQDAKEVLRTIRFTERRFGQERAYPGLKLLRGQLADLRDGELHAEQLLLRALGTVASLEISAETADEQTSGDFQIHAEHSTQERPKLWDMILRRKPSEPEAEAEAEAEAVDAISLESVRSRFIDRMNRDAAELQDACEVLTTNHPAEEAIDFVSSHAHRTAGIANTLGFFELGEAAAKLDRLMLAVGEEDGQHRVSDEIREQSTEYLRAFEQFREANREHPTQGRSIS